MLTPTRVVNNLIPDAPPRLSRSQAVPIEIIDPCDLPQEAQYELRTIILGIYDWDNCDADLDAIDEVLYRYDLPQVNVHNQHAFVAVRSLLCQIGTCAQVEEFDSRVMAMDLKDQWVDAWMTLGIINDSLADMSRDELRRHYKGPLGPELHEEFELSEDYGTGILVADDVASLLVEHIHRGPEPDEATRILVSQV